MSFVGPPVPHHKKGWTVATYDVTGGYIVSGGSDGKVKVLDDVKDSSPMEHIVGEKINAVACKPNTIILASEGTYVHMLQIDDGLPDGMATRFTAEINDVALNKDHSKLATCSSDFLIKIVNFASSCGEDREFTLEGHKGAVLSVAYDPLDIFVASASCDGTVRIWRVDKRKEVKSIQAVAKCNDPQLAPSICRLCWEANEGKFLAVPVDKEVRLYERDTWQVLCLLTSPSITQPITVCSSSVDGSLLASGSKDGLMVVWKVNERSVIHCLRDVSESEICSLSWHPHQTNSLLYANKNGCLGLLRVTEPQHISSNALSPRAMETLLGCDEDGDTDEMLRAAAAQAESSRLMDDIAEHVANSDDDDAGSIDLSRIKSGFLIDDDKEEAEIPKPTDLIQPEAEAPVLAVLPTEIDRSLTRRIQKPFQSGSMPLSFHERFMVWNRVGIVTGYRGSDAEESDKNAPEQSSCSIEVEFHDTSVHHSLRLSNGLGYTMADLSLTALLLASPGTNDPSLADDAAAGVEIDAADISHIALLPLDTTTAGGGDTAVEWVAKLPPGEACETVCLVPNTDGSEKGFAVVATSRHILRIFLQPSAGTTSLRSSSSLHLFQLTKLGMPPISIPGCGVVTMSSHPSQPILAVVVSVASGELNWRLYYLGGVMFGEGRTGCPAWLTGSVAQWQPLPLSPAPSTQPDLPGVGLCARLKWVGFSDLGALYTHDACGVVRRLLHGRTSGAPDYHWVPVCDTHSLLKPSNRYSDNYFVVGVLELAESVSTTQGGESGGMGQLQVIYCKASKWPRVFPRPVVSNLPFRLPLCSLDTDQGTLEENYLRYAIGEDWPVWGPNSRIPITGQDETTSAQLFDSTSNKCTMKRKGILLRLFALAAKFESDWASLAVARLMPDASTVQLAIRYAGRLRRQNLANRLAAIALEKEQIAVSVSSEDENSDEDPPGVPQRNSRESVEQQPCANAKKHEQMTDQLRCRHLSEASDLANISLVSSATDDTHEEGQISELPLPDSEPVTHSFLLSTPSSAARNPFRDKVGPVYMNQDGMDADVGIRRRGSEVLDSWKPKPTDNSTGSKPPTRKRAAPAAENKHRSKLSKANHDRNAEELGGFTDWFEKNRTAFEEEYADQSADELLRTARARFQKMKSSRKNWRDEKPASRVLTSKENTLTTNKKTIESSGKSNRDEDSSNFAAKASKRLSSFKFGSDHSG
ncbi:unnamed protein product [Calicophoron daubneyi]|uniref:Minichromosome loss protein Mcl1 middle region domain-containing protein n=1 Tax=Calicophoron daubneyi TaxID=300641 RepID=A0AAV2T8Q6_CALDB